MRESLREGVFAELDVTVVPAMCPHFDGVLIHPVCATWEIVHHMEVAGRKVLAPHLDPDEEGIGAGIEVEHRSPASLHSIIRFRADFESLDRGRLWCRTQARVADRLVAAGRFLQIVMPRSRMQALFDRHAIQPT